MFSLQLPKRDERGFTLIELLVVIIIIGILAAIAIPLFLDQRKLAVDASVKSDVRNTSTQVQTWLAQNPGSVATDATDYKSKGGNVSSSTGNTVNLSVATDGSYLVCGYAGTAAKNYTAASAAYVYDSTSGKFGLGSCTGGIVGGGSPSATSTPTATTSAPTSTNVAYATPTTYTASNAVSGVTGSPYGVSFSSAGDLYYVSADYRTVLKAPSTGGGSVFAGSTSLTGSIDGTGTSASFNQVLQVAVDSSGNVYAIDNNVSASKVLIRKITPAGVVSTLTTLTTDAYYGLLKFGPDGNLYYASQKASATNAVVKIDPATGTQTPVFSLAGTGVALNGLWIAPNGTIYGTTASGSSLLKVTGATTYALSNTGMALDVTGDSAGNVYTTASTMIYKYPAGSLTGTQVAGSGTSVAPNMTSAYGTGMAPSGRLYYWQTSNKLLYYLN